MGSKTPRDGIVLMTRPATHEADRAHPFNHTDGICPKCSNKNHMLAFCLPGQSNVPRVQGCEVDGEHLHRQCAACGYPWVERCYDQLLLSQQEGWLMAESQLIAALACVADSHGGITANEEKISTYKGWKVKFVRDPAAGTITITTEPVEPAGDPAHPDLRANAQRGPGGAA